ncbi:hypothetical protein GCM10027418_17000 [Mariniluteicoccus endophyticus]
MAALATPERRLVVVGNSWGTFLGVHLVQRRPDLVAAYVGTGQMVSLRETDVLFHTDTLAWAERTGRTDVVRTLTRNGPPPHREVYPYEPLFSHEGAVHPWDRDPAIGARINPMANVMDKPELDPVAKLRYLANLVDTFGVLYPQVQDIDLRRTASRLDVPVYLAAGTHEARGRAVLVDEWYAGLQAPHKEWVRFERSGHKPFGEEPELFALLLRRVPT